MNYPVLWCSFDADITSEDQMVTLMSNYILNTHSADNVIDYAELITCVHASVSLSVGL